MHANKIDELLDELDDLRAPRGHRGRKCLGISIGPYVHGAPERGYGTAHLERIREIRRILVESTKEITQ